MNRPAIRKRIPNSRCHVLQTHQQNRCLRWDHAASLPDRPDAGRPPHTSMADIGMAKFPVVLAYRRLHHSSMQRALARDVLSRPLQQKGSERALRSIGHAAIFPFPRTGRPPHITQRTSSSRGSQTERRHSQRFGPRFARATFCSSSSAWSTGPIRRPERPRSAIR